MSVDLQDYMRRVIQHIDRERESILSQRKTADSSSFLVFDGALQALQTLRDDLESILKGYVGKTLEDGLRHFFEVWRKEESRIHAEGEYMNPDLFPAWDRGHDASVRWFLRYCDNFQSEYDPGHLWEYCHIECTQMRGLRKFLFYAEDEGMWNKVLGETPWISPGLFQSFDTGLSSKQAIKAHGNLVDKLLADGWELVELRDTGRFPWWQRVLRRKPR